MRPGERPSAQHEWARVYQDICKSWSDLGRRQKREFTSPLARQRPESRLLGLGRKPMGSRLPEYASVATLAPCTHRAMPRREVIRRDRPTVFALHRLVVSKHDPSREPNKAGPWQVLDFYMES
jgi:hypothetical protein